MVFWRGSRRLQHADPRTCRQQSNKADAVALSNTPVAGLSPGVPDWNALTAISSPSSNRPLTFRDASRTNGLDGNGGGVRARARVRVHACACARVRA